MKSIMAEKVYNKHNFGDHDKDDFVGSKWGTRHNQCILLFFTLTIAYSMRSCMGVALVAMTLHEDHLAVVSESIVNVTDSNITDSYVIDSNVTDSNIIGSNITDGNVIDSEQFRVNGFFNALLLSPPYPSFRWSKKIQDTLISAFVWGYMTLQVPGGHLAYKFGARYLLFGALLINCVLALLFPIACYYGGWVCALICRMGQGLSQACILPSFHTILGKWAPLEERGRLSGIIYGGQALGTVLGLPLTGFIASSPLGWPGTFRFYGILSGIIAVILWIYLADSPDKHKTISAAERRYIEDALRQRTDKKLAVPWKKILTSTGMLAIVIGHIGNNWGHLILYSEVPAYMDKVMGVNIKANGLLTALPFVMMFVFNFFFSWLTDMLIVKKILNVTQTRKMANSIGCVPAAIGFIILAYAPKNIYIVESILVAICCFKTATTVGFNVNHIDISPNFAGVMMSISNFSSNAVGSFAPIVAGLILTDVSDERLWRIVFFIAAGFYFISNLVYVILGTGELADWNDPTQYERVALSDNIHLKVEKDNKESSDDVNKDDMTIIGSGDKTPEVQINGKV
ncbi:putative inorganic phosphate cotransporter [Ostrinia furnacalis]|uniref:putative inorganic phosphate cotransporter n=1 Tax=Ostrinia furnacalis TaxID=93504 RepID=UPI00103D3F8E|nr:putative inorganic phosphate cotransporter [Ostrinia furnacalis]